MCNLLEGRLSGRVAIFGQIAKNRNILEKSIEQKLNTIEFMADSNAFITLIWPIYNLLKRYDIFGFSHHIKNLPPKTKTLAKLMGRLYET